MSAVKGTYLNERKRTTLKGIVPLHSIRTLWGPYALVGDSILSVKAVDLISNPKIPF